MSATQKLKLENAQLREEIKKLKKKNEQWEEWSRLVLLDRCTTSFTIDCLIEAGLLVDDDDGLVFPKLPNDSKKI